MPVLHDLQAAVRDRKRYVGLAASAEERRDELVRRAMAEGLAPVRVLADMTGLSVQRIHQINKNRPR